MFRSWLLLALLAVPILAPAVDGPYRVIDSSPVYNYITPQVVAINEHDTRLYFVQTYNDSGAQAFYTTVHDSLFDRWTGLDVGSGTQAISDAARDGAGNTSAIIQTLGYVDGVFAHRTYCVAGNTARCIFTGDWDGGNWGTTRQVGLRLSPRVGGGLLLTGSIETRWGFSCELMPFVSAFASGNAMPDWSQLAPGPEVTLAGWSGRGVSFHADSAFMIVQSLNSNDVYIGTAHAGADTLRNPMPMSCGQAEAAFGMTSHGRLFLLEQGWDTGLVLYCKEITPIGTCEERSRLSPPTESYMAAEWNPDFGFALAFTASASDQRMIQIARIDTLGREIHSLTTLHVCPPEEWIDVAVVDISPDGHVAVAWKAALRPNRRWHRVYVASFDWDDPLAADDSVVLPPTSFALSAFPNPFNGELTIRYELPRRAYTSLEIYNSLGQRMASLCDGEQSAGAHEARWTPSAATGIYFARLQTGDHVQMRKVLYLR